MLLAFLAAWLWLVKRALSDHKQLPYCRYRCAAGPPLGWLLQRHAQLGLGAMPAVTGPGPWLWSPLPRALAHRNTHIFVRVQARVLMPVISAVVLAALILELIPSAHGTCLGAPHLACSSASWFSSACMHGARLPIAFARRRPPLADGHCELVPAGFVITSVGNLPTELALTLAVVVLGIM